MPVHKHVRGGSSTLMSLVCLQEEHNSLLGPGLSLSLSRWRHELDWFAPVENTVTSQQLPAGSRQPRPALPLQESSLSHSCGASSLTLCSFCVSFPPVWCTDLCIVCVLKCDSASVLPLYLLVNKIANMPFILSHIKTHIIKSEFC